MLGFYVLIGMVFFTESWFWRGTQSAIFYYAACTPWVEYKHNRKRRKEAARKREEKDQSVIYTQPGIIRQPDPFETNEEWAQEIVQGPGPPKGWKRDPLYNKHLRKFRYTDFQDSPIRPRGLTANSTESPAKSVFTGITDASTVVDFAPIPASVPKHQEVYLQDRPCAQASYEADAAFQTSTRAGSGLSHRALSSQDGADDARGLEGLPELNIAFSRETGSTGSKRSSFETASASTVERRPSAPRPSMEKRLSTAMDGFRDTMKAALHPEQWNWIRYDRDDEILSNINERMKGMWDSVKGHVTIPLEEEQLPKMPSQAKAASMESEVKKWQRGTHPAVNDMSPPIVSQLPYTREEAQWMLLPPPSADVMMGRSRPDFFDDVKRKPLCIIGRPVPMQNLHTQLTCPDSSDKEDGEMSDTDEAEWTHLQKPQRAHLYKRRASYGFERQ